MKRSRFTPATVSSRHIVERGRGNASAANVPVGFHPLSEQMVDVLVTMQEQYLPSPDWWQRGAQVREMAMKYYQALRQVLRTSRPSERRLTRCCQCEIFF